MKLESQVTSLGLSKRLRELKVPQRGCLFAHYFNGGKSSGAIVDATMYDKHDDDFWSAKLVAAYTCSELGEMLPQTIREDMEWLSLGKNSDESWHCAYVEYDTSNIEHHADNLANAMAKMLIYLLESGLTEISGITKSHE